MGRKKEKGKPEANTAFANMGIGALVNAICWFATALFEVVASNSNDGFVTIFTLLGIFAAPVIMITKYGLKGATFASFLTFVNTIAYIVVNSNYPNDSSGLWLMLTTGGLVVAFIWYLILRSDMNSPKDESSNWVERTSGCIVCEYDGIIDKPNKWLDVPYQGICYACLGKNNIDKDHPNYEASVIMEKYLADLYSTKLERHKLKKTYEEMAKQKLQGPEALGDALYQQTIKLEQQYYDQATLRDTQIEFLEQGLGKIHRLLYNSMLAENMLNKQKELTEMFDDNANDLGSVMSLKAQLEMHTDVIDRINALNIELGMHDTTSIAKDLEMEIKQMDGQN